ncbi:helix-turn-helix domain-containing protein [Methylobacterium sp. GC_Met_2]|uniref:MarR family transcriptional regulator n=1 Tax=Methylobacterium sp. GC_Met_2 TaxID=2937376 RepID=UPI00226B66EB|nr:helix-turn-helix domain-containing protein [Methylobacterium sp. GC_Met_2]
MLAADPGHSNADLARLALLTPQTMSAIVANLLKADLIARQPHQVHGRIQTNALSEGGAIAPRSRQGARLRARGGHAARTRIGRAGHHPAMACAHRAGRPRIAATHLVKRASEHRHGLAGRGGGWFIIR